MPDGMADLVRAWSRAYRKGSGWQTKDATMRKLRHCSLVARWKVLVNLGRVMPTHAPAEDA